MPASLRVSAAAFAATLAALGAVWAAMDRPDSLIERSFADAFERLEAPRAASLGTAAGTFDPAHLHLSRLPAAAAASPALTVGDRMTIADRTGGSIAYEVIEVRPLAGDRVPGMTLVTAVSVGQTPARTMRFIVDADGEGDAVRANLKPHAL